MLVELNCANLMVTLLRIVIFSLNWQLFDSLRHVVKHKRTKINRSSRCVPLSVYGRSKSFRSQVIRVNLVLVNSALVRLIMATNGGVPVYDAPRSIGIRYGPDTRLNCCVEGCVSMYGDIGISFHRFPTINTARDVLRRELWVEAAGLPNDANVIDNALICGRHFEKGEEVLDRMLCYGGRGFSKFAFYVYRETITSEWN